MRDERYNRLHHCGGLMLLQLTISVQSDEKKPLPSLPNFISPLARLNTCEVEVHVGGWVKYRVEITAE